MFLMTEREPVSGQDFGAVPAENPALEEKSEQWQARRNQFLIGAEGSVFMPTRRDLQNPELFLPLKAALSRRDLYSFGRKLFQILPVVVAGSEITIFGFRKGYRFRGELRYHDYYFVPTGQAPALRDLFEQKRQLIEEKKRSEPKKGPHPLSRLKPEDIDGIVGKLTDGYATDEPIFYRSDSDPKFKEIFPFSRQTLNDILTIAQKNGVIAVPYREKLQSGRAFYSREEIVDALEHFGKLRQRGEALSSTAKRLRAEACEQEAVKLTLKEAANKLGVIPSVLHRWIVEGKVDLGSPILNESIRRRLRARSYNLRLFDLALLDDQSIRQRVREYQERFEDLDRLTASRFPRYRNLFSTVSEAAREAGFYISRKRFSEILQVLRNSGIKIVDLPLKNAKGEVLASCYVLAKKDKQRAVRILRTDHDLEDFRRNPVQLVCGPPIDPLPTTTQLLDRQKYLRPAVYLSGEFAIKIGGKSGITVASFFGEESPVSILKYVGKILYYFPREQEPIARQFVEAKKQTQLNAQAQVS